MTTTIVSQATAAVAELGPRARLCDLYDTQGGPIYHDITCADDSELREVLLLLRKHAPQGPVLELAAGAGRMALPILASGRAVTALDASGTLLGILQHRLKELAPAAAARADLFEADVSSFVLDRQYAVIVLGSTTITLVPPPRRPELYRCVRQHLQPAGRFIVTVPLPIEQAAHVPCLHRIAIGISGRRYHMYDEVIPGTDYRTVTVIPHLEDWPTEEPVPVATSQPALFDDHSIEDELSFAGFELIHEIPLGGLTERLAAGLQVWEVAS